MTGALELGIVTEQDANELIEFTNELKHTVMVLKGLY